VKLHDTTTNGQRETHITGAPVADPVTTEIIRYSLLSITDQIEANLARTAYSPLIYVYKDYCVGLLDTEGRILAQSRGSIPIFLADLGTSVVEALQVYGRDGLEPGDVLITNNPATLGQHLNNVDMLTPVHVGGSLFGFMSIRAHWADVGGRYVGSASSNDTTDIFQEGIQYPCLKLLRRGERAPEVYRLIRANTRFPETVLGDVEAQLAGCLMGRDLLVQLVEKYGVDVVSGAITSIWNHAEAAARAAVSSIPDGVYEAESFLDNDGISVDRPINIHVCIEVSGDEMTIDLSGIADQVMGPYNSGRTGGGLTAAKVAFKYVTTGNDTVSEGSFRNLRVVLPDGKFLSASPQAAKARYSTPLPTVVDTIIRALAPAIPDKVGAGHHASMGAYMFTGTHPQTGQLFKNQDTAHGGWGARLGADGAGPFKTLAHGDTLDIPVEVQEALYPMRVDEYSVRTDSAGAGQWRGGMGLNKHYTVLSPCRLTTVFERSSCPPWGLFGGLPAEPGSVLLLSQGAPPRSVQKTSDLPLSPGDRLVIRSGGGGGYGEPWKRPVEAVAADVQSGYVSIEAARRDYGVVISGEGQVDLALTEELRAQLARGEQQ
jgi:N-methylhydantoinase B